MTTDDFTLHVHREDGEQLELDGRGLARAFFGSEAMPPGYDPFAGLGDPGRVLLGDVITMNATMRSRSRHVLWDPILTGDQRWLRRIPLNLDIVESDEHGWAAAGGDDLMADAVRACLRPGIGLAGATKLLHLKRPRFMPILDQLVAEMMGIRLPDGPTVEQRLAVAGRLTSAIRVQARRNVGALRAIQVELAERGIARPLIRIFDAVVWSSHPVASITGATRSIGVRVRA